MYPKNLDIKLYNFIGKEGATTLESIREYVCLELSADIADMQIILALDDLLRVGVVEASEGLYSTNVY